ncbi:MAG: helix-turn-helix domain-containing protein [Vallitaleaceae bacterium]|nr:helix-turn-helix domain-containing protein [Vallitaleaceae bacterium]
MEKMDFNHDVSYVNIGKDPVTGIVTCGFLPKTRENQKHNFIYYGGFLVLSGTGQYISQEGEVYPLSPGNFVQRRPGIPHTTIIDDEEPWLEFYVCFGAPLYKSLVDMGIISDAPVLKIALDALILGQCENLLYTFKKAREKDKKNLLLSAQEFILRMNRANDELTRSWDHEQIIEQIAERLSGNFDQNLDLQEIAQIYHMSYEKLRKDFKASIGVSPHHYLILQRMNEARRLLHQPNITIKEIATRLGFVDQYAFSNQFKKMVGVSPKVFRETY